MHFAGGCFRVPGEHFSQFEDCGQREPDEHEYSFRCKDCFPALKPAAREEEEAGEASSSDGSSSSSSSEFPEEDAEE